MIYFFETGSTLVYVFFLSVLLLTMLIKTIREKGIPSRRNWRIPYLFISINGVWTIVAKIIMTCNLPPKPLDSTERTC
jgi:hypothetical protein